MGRLVIDEQVAIDKRLAIAGGRQDANRCALQEVLDPGHILDGAIAAADVGGRESGGVESHKSDPIYWSYYSVKLILA